MRALTWVSVSLLTLIGACAQPDLNQPIVNANEAVGAQRITIVGHIRARLTDEPLFGVRVGWNGTNLQTLTDEYGRFTLPSRTGFSWLDISGEGVIPTLWRPKPVMHVWTTQRDEALERKYLIRRPLMDSDPLDDPDLTDRARSILAGGDFFAPELPTVRPTQLKLKQSLQPPATIRLYRRGPEDNSCLGRVDVIPLEEYVRGVVPHEWISSWHEESLRAGAIAARSYAWGWILAGGKLDCADLDDTTRSQVYEDTRNARADVAVSSTTGVGIYDPNRGQVVTSEYSAENSDPTDFGVCEPLCTGETLFGHGRGMCQWGTSRWASRQITQLQSDILADCAVSSPAPIVGTGQIAEWMVSHYFPGKYTTALEDSGASLELSQGLQRIGAFSCALPERGFGCADFVPEGQSEGVFDSFLGRRLRVSYGVTNTGSVSASEVVWTMAIPRGVEVEPSVNAGQWDIEGGVLTVRLAQLESGARADIVLDVSVTSAGRHAFQPYIAQIENQYDKRGWGAQPIVNVGQTFNGGDLRQLTEVDVFDPMQWDFRGEPDLNPIGWQGNDLAFDSGSDGLRVSHERGGMIIFDSPHLYGDRLGMDTLLVRSTDVLGVAIRYDGQDGFQDLGTGIGARAFSISSQRRIFQIRLTGTSPFTVESVLLRNRVSGAGGVAGGSLADAGPETTVSPRVDAGSAAPAGDGGNTTAIIPSNEPEGGSGQGVRGSGSCSQNSTHISMFWVCLSCVLLLGVRRRRL